MKTYAKQATAKTVATTRSKKTGVQYITLETSEGWIVGTAEELYLLQQTANEAEVLGTEGSDLSEVEAQLASMVEALGLTEETLSEFDTLNDAGMIVTRYDEFNTSFDVEEIATEKTEVYTDEGFEGPSEVIYQGVLEIDDTHSEVVPALEVVKKPRKTVVEGTVSYVFHHETKDWLVAEQGGKQVWFEKTSLISFAIEGSSLVLTASEKYLKNKFKKSA